MYYSYVNIIFIKFFNTGLVHDNAKEILSIKTLVKERKKLRKDKIKMLGGFFDWDNCYFIYYCSLVMTGSDGVIMPLVSWF